MQFSQGELFDHLIQSGVLVKARKKTSDSKSIVPVNHGSVRPQRSVLLNPNNRLFSHGKGVVDPNRGISYRMLRRVAEKAWLINTIITHQSNRIRPFLRVSSDSNVRGFQIRMRDEEKKPGSKDKERIKELQKFFLKTGWERDTDREDDFVKYTMKLIRDLLTLDQISTEIQRTRGRDIWAYWGVDPATIFRVNEEGYEWDDKIKFIQEIDMVTQATYGQEDLVFDYMNPRTDIDHFGYGYSAVEQAVDLIVSMINTFMFNAGAFSEDRLPRGMIMLTGDADQGDVMALEQFIIDVMSNGPASKWRIPIIPSGGDKDKRGMEWISFQNSNQDMQFSQWTELLWSGVSALFGIDLEELGIKTSKNTSLMSENLSPRIEESKSRGL